MPQPTESSSPSFLREAFLSYAPYTSESKQEAQKRALKWLQSQIESNLSNSKMLEQFIQKWRGTIPLASAPSFSVVHLEDLPRTYKGSKSISGHQEEALNFLHEQVSTEIQEGFKQRWEAKNKLKVSKASETAFKIDERDLSLVKDDDPLGAGNAWLQVAQGDIYYLLSYEEKDAHYCVWLTEDLGLDNRNQWWVLKEDVTISAV